MGTRYSAVSWCPDFGSPPYRGVLVVNFVRGSGQEVSAELNSDGADGKYLAGLGHDCEKLAVAVPGLLD